MPETGRGWGPWTEAPLQGLVTVLRHVQERIMDHVLLASNGVLVVIALGLVVPLLVLVVQVLVMRAQRIQMDVVLDDSMDHAVGVL